MNIRNIFLAGVLAFSQFLTAQTNKPITVAIFSLNDFHGAFVQNKSQGIPGAPSVLQCLDSLKSVFPYNLTVAAGDNFGGSYFYNATHGVLLPVFFNDMGIRISALGNHEFDDGQKVLAEKWKNDPLRPAGWDIEYLCGNVYDQDGKVPSYLTPFTTAEIPLSPTKTLRAGFVGLLASSAKEQIRAKNIVGMIFSGNYTHVLDSIEALPAFKTVRDAEIRSLLVHIGTYMKNGKPAWTDKNEAELYAIKSPLYQSILSGHSHEPVCGRINEAGYPVVQGWWHGNYISVMKYQVDTTSMKVLSVEPEIVRVALKDRSQLGPVPLRLQCQIDSLLASTNTKGGVPIGTKLTVATEDMPHDRSVKYVESRMGQLVCSSFAEAFRKIAKKSDKEVIIGMSHFGSIRGGFSKGDVSVLEVGEALPFSNPLKVFKLTGRQLHDLVDFGFHNKRYGWIQTSNLETQRDADNNVLKMTYVSPKGKRVAIKDNGTYYVCADEFMTTGGDGYDPKFFPKSQEVKVSLPETTDAFITYLKQQKSIH